MRRDAVDSRLLTLALGVSGLVAAAVVVVDALVLPALDLQTASRLHFLSAYASPDYLKPEPLEQQRYLVAVLATLALPWLIAVGAGRAWLRRCCPPIAALPSTLAIVGLVGYAWFHDPSALAEYLPLARSPWLVGTVALAVAAALAQPRLTAWMHVGGRGWEALSALVALLATATLCLAGFYYEDDLVTALVPTGTHMPFTFQETFAVAGGHTPFVDWTPQYAALLPYLLAPVLALCPYNISTFTGAMVITSTGALMLVYGALRLVAGRPLAALALYLPVLGVGLIPVFALGDQVHSIAAYYALMPMRYAGPLACLAAVAVFARYGSGRGRDCLLLGSVAAATVINNFEFGLPAAAATVLAALLCAIQLRPRATWGRQLLASAGWLGAGALAALAGFVALTLARSGELPDLTQLVYFSRQFATAGFFMLPIDTIVGLPGVIFLTFVAAVVVGATPVLLGRVGSDPRSRVRAAVLVYTGVFGLGVLAYWIGRSADPVLAATLLAWALALAALAAAAGEALPGARASARRRVPGTALAALALVVFGVAGVAGLARATYGFEQLERVTTRNGELRIATQTAVVQFTRECLAPGTDVGMFVPYGLRVAHEAGVRDRFPYSNPTSVVTQEQIDHIFRVFSQHDVELVVTGVAPEEFKRTMSRHGFRKLMTGTNPIQIGYTSVDTGPVLELWGTPARRGVRCGPDA